MTFLATLVASFHFLTRRMRTDPISKAPFGGTTARPLFMGENAPGDGRRRKEAKCGAGQSCKMSNDRLGIFLVEHTACRLRQFLGRYAQCNLDFCKKKTQHFSELKQKLGFFIQLKC